MQQEAGNPLLPATALPKIKTKPAAATTAQARAARAPQPATARPAAPPAAKAAPAQTAAPAAISTLLIEAERRLLLKKTLTARAPSKENPTSKNSS